MDKKMSGYQKEESYQLIPKKELKCVWMNAGLLSYKLCKYDLQCEKCPLDWELRNLSSTPSFDSTASPEAKNRRPEEAGPTPPLEREEEEKGELREDLSHLNIKESLFYHPGHTWIKVERANEVRVGIDDFLGGMIGKVNVVLLPLSGSRGIQGETLCSVIQEEGILHIVSPISGLILSVNQRLKDQPELISRDPLGDGFLLTLKPKNLQRDQKNFFFGEAALSWYRKEWERFKEDVISELHHSEGRLGMTMQDGGIKLREIKKLIGPERYIRLVNTFLRKGEKIFSNLEA
jgi:glycine cleavage system H protein